MFGKLLTASVFGLTSSFTFANNYNKVYTSFGTAIPSELNPTSQSARQFGRVVAVSGSLVAVSSNEVFADYDQSGAIGMRGRVSLYGMNYLRTFTDSGVDFSSSNANDGYGTSLDLREDTMLVGAPFDSSGGENAGAAYVYFGSNFQSYEYLTAEHSEKGDYFGYSVAISEGQNSYGSKLAVVGAYGHDHDKESTVGQGYVFVFAMDSTNSWSAVGKLEPQDFEHKDHGGFGYALSAYGNTVAVGTYSAEKAFVFELLGQLHECPPERDMDKDDYPSDCYSYNSRQRYLQGMPENEKRWYTEWKYEHILTVGIEEEHKPEMEKQSSSYSFGHAVSMYNNSGVLSLAVGAPDAIASNGAQAGLVYVLSIMNRGDVQSGWYPEGYDHHEEDKRAEEAEREAERQQREAEEQAEKESKEQGEADRGDGGENVERKLQGEEDKNRFRTWNILQNKYCGDKMGNFWMKEAVISGSSSYEKFGHSLQIGYNTLLVGNNPTTYQDGKAIFYERIDDSGSYSSEYSPVISGPLYNKKWSFGGALQDSRGVTGDHFGFSVAFEGDIAAVGTVMNNIKQDGTFGQGVTYIYDRIKMIRTSTPSPTFAPTQPGHSNALMNDLTDTHSAIGITFVSAMSIIGASLLAICGIMLYRGKVPFSKPSEKQVRLATMDDSGYSTNSSVQQRNSTYSNLDSSSSHSLNRLPGHPNPSKNSRTFTPQAQRSFTPKKSESSSML